MGNFCGCFCDSTPRNQEIDLKSLGNKSNDCIFNTIEIEEKGREFDKKSEKKNNDKSIELQLLQNEFNKNNEKSQIEMLNEIGKKGREIGKKSEKENNDNSIELQLLQSEFNKNNEKSRIEMLNLNNTNKEKNIELQVLKDYSKEDNKINSENKSSKDNNKKNNIIINESKEKENEKIKLFGLVNPKFNCYLNSSLQVFFHLDNFNKVIMQNSPAFTNKKLTQEYCDLLKKIEKNNNKIINPIKIKEILSEVEEKYKYDNQEDANEFITLFLNEMLKEVKGIGINNIKTINIPKDKSDKEIFEKFYDRFFKKNNSFLLNLFYGILKKDIFCPNNHKIKVNFQRFNSIDLPKKTKENSIEELLKKYQEKKIIDCEIECQQCGFVDYYYSKTIIYTLPDYIILFSDNPINNIHNFTIKVNEFYEGENNNNDIYELVGVIGYSGNFKSGHYIAKCKVTKDKWYYFSDSHFSEIENTSIINEKDVILFFAKK